ncbi:hypothetical protein MGALJ_26640 [Mycobacterium gallinarum]|uniref:Uncharacterized protein n=1 Tax=Mycobacterium gallinarum TaxID=39689 RepID=A0A9W4FFC9_9MYCO|nr:hypothetical protein MGALJ_26640 [Mycobacterium gallinarum]
MLESRGYPRRLLRGKKVVRRIGLDLDDAVQRVLDLVHLVAVPSGDQPVALVQVAAAECPTTPAEFNDASGGAV